MSTPRPRVRRPPAHGSGSDAERTDDSGRRSESPARRDAQDTRPLLARILDTPHLAQVVPRLPPEVLHRVIERCGLEDCAELVALATPEQLTEVLDLDLWRTDRPGLDERFNADRFGVWLEVLMESGAAFAARTLAALDPALVTTALAQHVRVFDLATVSPSGESDGDETPTAGGQNPGLSIEMGSYLIAARRPDAWDAVAAVLVALDAAHHDAFHRVMRGCRRLSNSAPEVDGLDNLLTASEQVMFDLASGRERRRERQGYATPAEARAFLQMSRHLPVGKASTPPTHPVAAAYFRAIDEVAVSDATGTTGRLPAPGAPLTPDDSASAVASFVDVLVSEGVIPRPPRALLDSRPGPAPRLALIEAHMRFVHNGHAAAFAMRSQELAFLANTLVAGCSIQARPFTVQEASDAVVAACNLGLENWPPHWLTPASRADSSALDAAVLPEGFLADHDLVTVFQVGWTVLHQQVCLYAAERLIAVIKSLTCDDRDIQSGLVALRKEMATEWRAGTPWRARDALDVLMILDMPAWAAILGLIDECPVIHAAIGTPDGSRARAVSASAFEFISENIQIASVREFMRSLPEMLR